MYSQLWYCWRCLWSCEKSVAISVLSVITASWRSYAAFYFWITVSITHSTSQSTRSWLPCILFQCQLGNSGPRRLWQWENIIPYKRRRLRLVYYRRKFWWQHCCRCYWCSFCVSIQWWKQKNHSKICFKSCWSLRK